MKKLIAIIVFLLAFVLTPAAFISREDYQKYLSGQDYVQGEDYNEVVDELLDGSAPDSESDDRQTDKSDTEADNQKNAAAPEGLDKKALSQEQAKVYEELLKQVREFKSEYTLHTKSDKDATAAYEALGQEHPEFIWLVGSCSWNQSVDEQGESIVTITQKSGYDMSELKSMYNSTLKQANRLVQEAEKQKSDYDKILYIHDQMTEKISYDFEAYELNQKGNLDKLLLSATAYNALEKDKAICSGYSAAFQLVMNQLGYECGRICGTGIDSSEGHEWNYINVQGKYYYVDVTWDAPVSDEKGAEQLATTHDYFCITQEELLLSHKIDSGELKPVCNSMDLDYYQHNGTYFETYDFESVAGAIKNSSKQCSLKFATVAQAEAARKDLLDNKRIFEIIDGDISSSVSNGGNIITIYFS